MKPAMTYAEAEKIVSDRITEETGETPSILPANEILKLMLPERRNSFNFDRMVPKRQIVTNEP